ncbi:MULTISPECIES: carbon-nitrogen family hydrolase [unclassified Staphylococcus]|uniref:carbon-nitrogen family hydrolase n=1 Tax=unclassified Staphylococcus TaxID=91994 RepID=UPI0021D01F09|nr:MULTISPECIES: carbon-nitrogen family hydrolase [unclassified Staphylococcus]UXR69084.1 carbon-nitrogen family hydrolase [Staphylococcus sp. IVB6246]UXR73409.1 carbon-nitrogen family hydrolase [Staphylococcus sp. IVB6238]UXR75724.1 carbon-nitrogen family hydrolase [Staphylococcus sp. IVB6233]UXR79923.1 carbon-nitrogen family hydrolase [Staphylococcus sp. IVB6218]
MKIQLLQFNITPGDITANEKKITDLFAHAIDSDTDVVVLPEMWNNGYALTELQQKADQSLSRTKPFLQQLATQYDVDIVAGSVSNHEVDDLYNTALTVSRTGDILYQYNKIHLVPMLDEPKYLTAGDHVPHTFNLSDGTPVSQIICYDLRFPELSRYPAAEGAKIIFYVAQWPDVRLNHWRQLLQARAIENDMYVVAVNSCGSDGKTTYAGHSMVIDPNGVIIAETSEEEKVCTVNLDLSTVDAQRQAIPVFDNMRPDVYRYAKK